MATTKAKSGHSHVWGWFMPNMVRCGIMTAAHHDADPALKWKDWCLNYLSHSQICIMDCNNNTTLPDYYYYNAQNYGLYVRSTSEDVALQHLCRYLKGDVPPNMSPVQFGKYLSSVKPSKDTRLRCEIVNNIDTDSLSGIIRQKLTRYGLSKHPAALNIVATGTTLRKKLLEDDHFFDRLFTMSFTTLDVWLTSH